MLTLIGSSACESPSFELIQPLDDLLLDDFQDGDFAIPVAGRRTGMWYCFNNLVDVDCTPEDPSARMEGAQLLQVMPRGLGDEQLAFRASADDRYNFWGVGVPPVPGGDFYSLERVSGLRFRARSGASVAAATSRNIRVNFPNCLTNPSQNLPGDCGAEPDNHFGADCMLTSTWGLYEIRFQAPTQGPCSMFGQEQSSAEAQGFDGTTVTDIQFLVSDGRAFEFWLDDLEFFLPDP